MTKEEKIDALSEAIRARGIERDIALEIMSDIEDAERYRKNCKEILTINQKSIKELKKIRLEQEDRFELAANNYEEGLRDGLNSCAAGEWCYDLERAIVNVMYIALDPTYVRGWARAIKSAVNGYWYDGTGNRIEPIAFAIINLPEKKNDRLSK